jgi:hypothetical protein
MSLTYDVPRCRSHLQEEGGARAVSTPSFQATAHFQRILPSPRPRFRCARGLALPAALRGRPVLSPAQRRWPLGHLPLRPLCYAALGKQSLQEPSMAVVAEIELPCG